MCIFCNIIKKEKKSEIVYENGELIAFRDIKPSAPVHILVVPKKHISKISEVGKEDAELLGKMILTANKIALEQKIDDGYKLLFNVGRKGGQIIDHIHLHLTGGWNE